MSNPVPYQNPHVVVQQAPTNALGLAGFITSIVGIVSCGVLSPIGLLLSLVGLFKEPRGFAIAGAIIGAVGSVFMAVIGLGFVLAIFGIGTAAKMATDALNTLGTAQSAGTAILNARDANGQFPSEQAGNALMQQYVDPWQTPLRYERVGDSFRIISAGRDKRFGSGDDIKLDQSELVQYPPTSQPAGNGP